MNAFRVSIISGLAAAGIVCAAPSFASAAATREPLSVTVHYDEADAASDQGAIKLYARLRQAARQVCSPLEGRELHRHANWSVCYNQALSNAVSQVNRTAVTVLHQQTMHSERAS